MTALDQRPSTPATEAAPGTEHEPPQRRPRLWRVALVVLVVLLAGEGAARLVEPHLTPVLRWPDTGFVTHEEQLAGLDGDGELDLLIIGSSSVGAAIQPSEVSAAGVIEGQGYNYWVAGPPMRSVRLLAGEALVGRHEPSTVIIGVTMREFNDAPSLATHLANLRQSPGFEEASGDRTWLDPVDDRLQEVSALARQRGTLRKPTELIRDFRAPAVPRAVVTGDGYYIEHSDETLADEPPKHLAQEREVMADYVVAQPEVDALAGLIDDLGERGIRVLVVNLPVTAKFIGLADDGGADYDRYLDAVSSTAETHGAEWLDAMEHDWPDDHFRDVNHLNQRGVDALLPLVVDALKS